MGLERGSRRVRILLAGCLAMVCLLTTCQSYKFLGTEYPDPQAAPDFELQNARGGSWKLSDHRGQVVVLYFGYTSCPDICPATLAVARQVIHALEDQADQVTFLLITVDPERDTPELIANYTGAFHPDIVGLTGEPEALAAVFDAYGIVAEKEMQPESAVNYVVNHTTRLFLVDQEGALRLSFAFGTPSEDMVADLRHLLGDR